MFGKINNTYIYSPGLVRSGSTTTYNLLFPYKINNYNKFLKKKTNLAIKNKHLPFEFMNLPKNTFTYFITRDPWGRMRSLYYWGKQLSTEYKNYKNLNDFIYNKFIKSPDVSQNKYRYWDSIRWAGGIEQLNKYNIVINYKEIPKLIEKLNDEFNLKLDINYHIHSTNKSQTIKEEYNKESVEIINEYFKKEIDFFNYSYDSLA